jgi:GxxExxY protein
MEPSAENRNGFNDCSNEVIGACIEVHRHLGPGLLESAYEECLCHELTLRGLAYERQTALPIRFKDLELRCGYRLDVVVEREVVVEIKAVERLLPVHHAQVLTYLRFSRLPVALLVNFNEPAIRRGLRRVCLG